MIKVFTNEDFSKCCELFIEVFNAPPWYDAWTSQTAKTYLQDLIDNKRFLGYTVWDNNQLIGVVFCHSKCHYRGDEIFIDELFISSGHRRNGYGKALMHEVEQYAKDNAVVSVTLLTGTGKPAFEFYKRMGYKHLEHLAFLYKRMA